MLKFLIQGLSALPNCSKYVNIPVVNIYEIRPYLQHFALSIIDFYEQNLESKRLRQLEVTQYIETD